MTLPLLWVSLAFMAGIILASALSLDFLIWIALALMAVAATVLAHLRLPKIWSIQFPSKNVHIARRTFLIALAALAGLFFGAARYQIGLPTQSLSEVATYNDAGYEVLVSGTLIEPADVRDTYTNLRLVARDIDTGAGAVPVQGLVLARVGPNRSFQYGQNLRLRGELLTPPSNEDFSYRDYLARQGIRSYMPAAEATVLPGVGGSLLLRGISAVKSVSVRNIYRLFLDPEASLLAGILLGEDNGIPAPVERAFTQTGTSHIIAISGFNIAIIAGFFALVFNRLLGPLRGALAALAGIIFYTLLVGSEPPVVRAAIMGAIGLLAVQVGRKQVGVNTLVAVAAGMALVYPQFLWDVGFQLSVFATLGLIVYGGPFMDVAGVFIQRHVRSVELQRLASPLAQFLVLTLAAQLTTLPIIAFHFKQVSLVSPLANALILPVQPAVMILGGLAIVFSLVLYPLGQVLSWAAWPFTAYTIRLVEFFAAVPNSVIYLGRFSWLLVALFYGMLLAVTIAGANLKNIFTSLKTRFRYLSLWSAILVLLVLALLIGRLAAASPDGRLHVTFLDVGSADAIFIETPSGGHVLINGGPSSAAVSDALGRRMSPLDHNLEWLIVASTDEHQVASLPRLLDRFPPADVLFGAPEQASFSSGALMEQLIAGEIPVQRAEPGQTLHLGDGAAIKVLDVSSRGTTLLLEWNTFRMLLPIGANLDTLDALEHGAATGPVNVLLLGQSGYAPLVTPEWLHNLHPQLVVLSVAPADRDGLPSAETLELLEDYPMLRTDLNGWIEVATDGGQMWVTSENGSRETIP
jgi:competence protein ComEC